MTQWLGLGGVLILDVTEGGPADHAGLRPTTMSRNGRIVLGDIIIKVGDKPTPDTNAFLDALEAYKVGEKVDVTIDRHGQPLVVPVTLQAVE